LENSLMAGVSAEHLLSAANKAKAATKVNVHRIARALPAYQHASDAATIGGRLRRPAFQKQIDWRGCCPAPSHPQSDANH